MPVTVSQHDGDGALEGPLLAAILDILANPEVNDHG